MEKIGSKDGSYSARPYQMELLEAALEENTIVNLGTGAGKTYIAVMLIKELSYELLLYGKKSVFLVVTVPLVKQQAEYISLHTNLSVGRFTGDMDVDSWSQARWDQELEPHQVLVMTMTIFKNMILRKNVTFSHVNLLIFDECHHAVKNHDYVQIMRLYNEDPARRYGETRILGLTASLIPSKCKPGDLERKIVELEKTLMCRSQTAEDLKEVAKYATNPHEIKCTYRTSGSEREILQLKNILEETVNFLESFPKAKKKTEFFEIVKVNLEDCLHILLNLGIWCAYEFAVNGLEDIVGKIEDCRGYFADEWEKSLLHLGSTHLRMFIQESQKVLKPWPYQGFHMVDKVVKLLQHLRCDPTTVSKNASKLVGIIFTQRRTTAALLCKLLNLQIKKSPDLQHLKCDYVVGHDSKSGPTYLRKEARMSSKKQDEVLQQFRQGKINLLVSTSVVEEGVDVPKCNTVVRFDFPQNFRSYVQSKGRARAKTSKYILLIPEEDAGKLMVELSDYNSLVKELERICHSRHAMDDYEHLKHMVPPYTNKNGAKATIDSSLASVHRYCQIFPKDGYTHLTPDFNSEKRLLADTSEQNIYRVPMQEVEFRSTLTFPMSCPLKDPIQGSWFPNKRLADKSAALEAVRRLDEAGELDQHLKPILRRDESDDEDEGEGEEGGGGVAGKGNMEKSACHYPNIPPPSLSDCLPRANGWKNHLYIAYIQDATSGGLFLSLPDEAEQQLSFGILSCKPLPHLQIPEFSIYDNDKELRVKICKYHTGVTLLESEIRLLQDAHTAIFHSVLKIRPSWLKCDFSVAERNYLIVPLYYFPFVMGHMEAFIAFDLAEKLASLKPSHEEMEGDAKKSLELVPVQWPGSIEQFRNAIVVRNYADYSSKLLEVKEVSKDTVLSSPFPGNPDFSTYQEYFTRKYNCELTDSMQPALVCKPLADSDVRLQLLVSRFMEADGAATKKSDNRGRTINLFPETCSIYPLPANLWKLLYTVPSIIWRVECIMIVDPLRTRIAAETGIGVLPDGSEVTTCINFRGYKDMAFGSLDSQRFTKNENGECEMAPDCLYDPLQPPLRGPDNTLLLQALTTRSASDSINLERLETLGDSFLKFSTTVFLYHNRSTAHEGVLSKARARRVCNRNLFILAQRQDITGAIFSSGFRPRQTWVPPGYVFDTSDANLTYNKPSKKGREAASQHGGAKSATKPSDSLSVEEKHYLYHRLTDKAVADCIESLIGAYLVSGGISAALKFMLWMKVKIQIKAESSMDDTDEVEPLVVRMDEEMQPSSMSSTESYGCAPCPKLLRLNSVPHLPVFIQNSARILADFFHVEPTPHQQLDEHQEVELNRLLSKSMGKVGTREVLGWKFRDHTLLLQAVTHASYTKNRLTNCYQRLEFLGDAVLDYLITCHIYSTFPKYGPGEISSMRSALVNNFVFAELAVDQSLHKCLLYNSPSLYKQTEQYLRDVQSCSTEELEYKELILNDLSSLKDGKGLAESLMGEGEIEEGEIVEGEEEEEEEVVVEDLDPPKVLGDLLESIAGAIFIDSGMSLETVWSIFQPLFDKKIDTFNGEIPVGPIQELFIKEPAVKVKKEQGGAGKRGNQSSRKVKYSVTVVHEGTPVRVAAVASTPKASKNAAAKALLKKLEKLKQSKT